MHDVIADVREKLSLGAREIMLVGQTVNAWKDPATDADFGDLCRSVAALPGLERLTYISPHPKDFTEKIIADIAAIPRINPRIHLPLQSGSDPILRRMNRKYTMEQFCEKVALIRRYLPNAAITTDIIVGFPGEEDADFDATLAYMQSGVFANAYMFIYSIRRGTPAARWAQVPAEVASARFKRLFDAQNLVTRRFHDAKIGTIVRALIQGPSKKDPSKLACKSLDNVTVIAAAPSDYDDALYAAQPWLDIAVESAHVWGCKGTILRRAARFDEIGSALTQATIDLLAV